MAKVDPFGLCLNHCWFIFTTDIYIFIFKIKSINLKLQTSNSKDFMNEFVKLAKQG